MRLPLAMLLLCAPTAVWATPLNFDLGLSVPPVVSDSKAPAGCTVTYLIADTANNDLFAARMRIGASETDNPVNNRLPCPSSIDPRVAFRALDWCRDRAADPKSCVFADMVRGFERRPELPNTAENASRCQSDLYSDIGVACWMAGGMAVCNVGCGASASAAVAQARTRCEEKQQHACPISGSVPILGP